MGVLNSSYSHHVMFYFLPEMNDAPGWQNNLMKEVGAAFSILQKPARKVQSPLSVERCKSLNEIILT